ncbi:hypothetical protein KGP36_02965 [Patescibacteria group bacterium]|nr:hypothetical protein [Patescibacteria group bacterium]
MTATSRLVDYLGRGLDSAKPTPSSITYAAGTAAMYWATDTKTLYLLSADGTTWLTQSGGSLSVSDGTTTESNVNNLVFSGATVSTTGTGEATVTIRGGGGSTWNALTFTGGVTVTIGGKTFTRSDQSISFGAGKTLTGQVLFDNYNNYGHGELSLFYSQDGVRGVAFTSQVDSNNVLYYQNSTSSPSWTPFNANSEGRTLTGPWLMNLSITNSVTADTYFYEGSLGVNCNHQTWSPDNSGTIPLRGTGYFYIENTSSTATFQAGRYKLESI